VHQKGFLTSVRVESMFRYGARGKGIYRKIQNVIKEVILYWEGMDIYFDDEFRSSL
jgi:hypothetical protein